jgi:hypothetical protein
MKMPAAQQWLASDCLPRHSEHYRLTSKFVPNPRQADSAQCSTCYGDGVGCSLGGTTGLYSRGAGEELCVTCYDSDRGLAWGYAMAFAKTEHRRS